MDDEERIVMQCKYCGQTIPDNANYCSGCGRAVREEATEVKRESKFWEQGWFAVLMLFIFWPVGLYLLWRYHGVFAKAIVGIFLLIILLTFIKPYPLSRTFLREREKQQFLPEPLLLSFY